MKKNINIKIILLAILVLISLISVIFIILSNKKSVEPTQQQQFIPPPIIKNYFGNNLQINQNLTIDDFINFPKDLPYLKQNSVGSFTNTEMNNIASNFGFTTDPIEINDTKNGKLYIWNNEKNSLVIYSNIRKIEFTPSYNPSSRITNALNKQISDEGYKNLAINIVSEKFNINKASLKFSNFIYLKAEVGLENYRVTNKGNAEITQVNLYSSNGTLPIFALDPQESQIYVQFMRDGELLNINGSFYSEYNKGETEFKIKDFQEVNETINDSVLVSLNDSNINLPDLKTGDITNVTVNNISLVYLQDSLTSEMLQPVFLLEGTASVKGFPKEVTASLYLSAYSQK